MSATATIRMPEAAIDEAATPAAVIEVRVARKRHMNWAVKAILPIAAVLLNGLLLFILVTLSL